MEIECIRLVWKSRLSYFRFGANQRYWLKTPEVGFLSQNIMFVCVLSMIFMGHLVYFSKPIVWTFLYLGKVIEKNWGKKEIRTGEKRGRIRGEERMKEESYFSLFLTFWYQTSVTHPRGTESLNHAQSYKNDSGFPTVCQGTPEVLFKGCLIDVEGKKSSLPSPQTFNGLGSKMEP